MPFLKPKDMLKTKNLKQFFLTLSLLLGCAWGIACNTNSNDGYSVPIKASHVQGVPKADSIEATIDGHLLSVVFLENLGEVAVNVTDVTGYNVEALSIFTPNGINFYITNTGTYIVHFTLPNGDTYYGEFEVTN